ncbi:MAG: sigma-70 family RNA polymerase sigma factor [Prevotella sp.]|jgi:RNA polymerase sigma factor (sigma-70 family)|nr:sigma-70 family RNA polymerase sigma factor [Prevotella sp.]
MRDGVDDFVDDSSLWNSFLSGNDEAFAYIYRRYVRNLFQYGLQFSSDRELIKDCIQDIFVKLYADGSKTSSTDNIKFYLFGALKNSLINALKRDRIHSLYLNLQEKQDNDYTAETAETLLINIESELSVKARVDRIMSQLTVRQREIIYYRFVENMSLDEISAFTKMNYQSVSNIIQRSLKKIRGFYKKVK